MLEIQLATLCRNSLFSLRFGEVLYCKNIINKSLFLINFKQRLQDCFQQDCDAFFQKYPNWFFIYQNQCQ